MISIDGNYLQNFLIIKTVELHSVNIIVFLDFNFTNFDLKNNLSQLQNKK